MSCSDFPLKLLLLSGGSLVGRNIVHAVSGRREHLILVASNSEPSAPDNFLYDRVYCVPPTRRPEFDSHFAHILEAEAPDLVIPCRDDDVVFLARWKAKYPAARVLAGCVELAEIMNDQWSSFVWSEQHNLPFAPSLLLSQTDALPDFVSRFEFPLIVKPRAGFASTRIQLCWNQTGLSELVARLEGAAYVVQPFIGEQEALRARYHHMQQGLTPLFFSFEGDKYSLQALIGPTGQCLQHWVTKHKMVQGRSLEVEACSSGELSALLTHAAEVFAREGWRGPLNIQCQRDAAGHYWIHEYNGRFTGATSARSLLGMDELGEVLRAYVSEDFPVLKKAQATQVLRLLSSTYVDPEAAQHLAQHKVWPERP